MGAASQVGIGRRADEGGVWTAISKSAGGEWPQGGMTKEAVAAMARSSGKEEWEISSDSSSEGWSWDGVRSVCSRCDWSMSGGAEDDGGLSGRSVTAEGSGSNGGSSS